MSKFDDDKSFSSQESDGRNFSFYLTIMENELFDENKNKPQILWNIKTKNTKKYGQSWIVLKNKEVILEVYESQLNKKETKFLEENIILFLTWVKSGLDSIAKLKKNIKIEISKDK